MDSSYWNELVSEVSSHSVRLDAFQPDLEDERIFCVGTHPKIPTAGYLCALACQFHASFMDQCAPANGVWSNPVAVVGAGLVGTYLTILLARSGVPVLLFETEGEIMPAFENCNHRVIHPNFILWPRKGWDDDTLTPLLTAIGVQSAPSWKVQRANSLRQEMLGLLKPYIDSKQVVFHKHATVTDPTQDDDRVNLKVSNGGLQRASFAILCPGKGAERCKGEHSYWRNEPIGRGLDFVLIVGVGDSGLIDAIKVQFDTREFGELEHGLFRTLIKEWQQTDRVGYDQICEARNLYEQDRRQRRDSARGFLVGTCDDSLEGLRDVVKRRITNPVKVIFVAPRDDHYTRSQTFLNQVIMRAIELEFPGTFQLVRSKAQLDSGGKLTIEHPSEVHGWNIAGISELAGNHEGKAYKTLMRIGLVDKTQSNFKRNLSTKEQSLTKMKEN